MNNEIRELSRDELDLVSGGGIITDAMDYAVGKGIEWLRTNVPNIVPDVQYNTTGRGDNNGCTGNKC
ncbi:hypothetical protein [Bradyrhizobium sp.]|jgi:hypothetical protein|uniref:hypothetical protein n=1 Tax=Bradyrhizobium sp. TaxID=376 RepID=UPI003BAFA867